MANDRALWQPGFLKVSASHCRLHFGALVLTLEISKLQNSPTHPRDLETPCVGHVPLAETQVPTDEAGRRKTGLRLAYLPRPSPSPAHRSILLSQSHCIALALVSDGGQECNGHCNEKASSLDQSRQLHSIYCRSFTYRTIGRSRQPASNIAQNMLPICCSAV